jgi:tetratricopeptide (TPR) repeat protein
VDGLRKERIREALEELVSWPAISRSPQLARFLSYIVEATLRGEEQGIKAYAIAVDVFGRPQSFDPQSDPIVRVRARRLRALLDQFYDEGHSRAGVRIHLPVGRYVPEFSFSAAEMQPDAPEPPAPATTELPDAANANGPDDPLQMRAKAMQWPPLSMLRQAAIAIMLTLAAGIGLILVVTLTRPTSFAVAIPTTPVVAIGEFVDLSGGASLDALGTRIAEDVRADLERFEDISMAPAGPAASEAGYQLSGVIHPAAQGIEVVASVGAGEATVWSGTYVQPSPAGGEGEIAAAVAFAIARDLGPFRGPLHETGRRWLDEQPRPLAAVNGYVCLLSYRLARETGNSNHIADALACHEKLLNAQPDVATALSASGWLSTRAVVNRALPDESMTSMLDEPLARAERALVLAPESSLVHEHLAAIRNWRGELDLAQQGFVEALRMNPLNTDARAGYAITLARAGIWKLAGEQAAIAIRDSPYPSPWYFYPAALNAYRGGRLTDAIVLGQRAAAFGGGEVGALITVAAAVELEKPEIIEPLLPRIMGMESLRRAGIMTWMAGQVSDAAVLERMAAALTRAGIPPTALTAPF